VLAVDSLGHGLSEKSYEPGDYRLPDAALDIVAAMVAAGVEQAALWGYSRGSVLVATVAASFPERVTGLILGGFWPPSGSTADEIDPSTEALMRGDWDAFWEIWRLDGTISIEDQRYMQESSDPRAIAAVELGRARSGYVIDPGLITTPIFRYYGSEDVPGPELDAELNPFGVPHILAGQHDHFTAFSDVAVAAPPVLAFLDNIYPPNP